MLNNRNVEFDAGGNGRGVFKVTFPSPQVQFMKGFVAIGLLKLNAHGKL